MNSRVIANSSNFVKAQVFFELPPQTKLDNVLLGEHAPNWPFFGKKSGIPIVATQKENVKVDTQVESNAAFSENRKIQEFAGWKLFLVTRSSPHLARK